MNKKLVWGVGIVAVVAVLAVWSAKSRNTQPRTISVNGECLTTAPKDRTAITLRVTTLDKSAAESMKQATANRANHIVPENPGRKDADDAV